MRSAERQRELLGEIRKELKKHGIKIKFIHAVHEDIVFKISPETPDSVSKAYEVILDVVKVQVPEAVVKIEQLD